jgi:hypothetical protein
MGTKKGPNSSNSVAYKWVSKQGVIQSNTVTQARRARRQLGTGSLRKGSREKKKKKPRASRRAYTGRVSIMCVPSSLPRTGSGGGLTDAPARLWLLRGAHLHPHSLARYGSTLMLGQGLRAREEERHARPLPCPIAGLPFPHTFSFCTACQCARPSAALSG